MTVPIEGSLLPSRQERSSHSTSPKVGYITLTQQQGQQRQGHIFAVNMVKDNRKNFTNKDYLHAVRAQELQVTVGCPLDKDLIKILKASSLPNCPVTPRDILIASKLFGPDVGALKRKDHKTRSPNCGLASVCRHYIHSQVLRRNYPLN